MANFARGLASGFKTGYSIGEALEARRERERIAEIMKEQAGLVPTGSEATPAQIQKASAETQALHAKQTEGMGLDTFEEQQRYMPTLPRAGERWTTGAPMYEYAGQRFAERPTDEQLMGLRYGRIADVIAERDPAAAMGMRLRQAQEARSLAAEQRAQRAAELADADFAIRAAERGLIMQGTVQQQELAKRAEERAAAAAGRQASEFVQTSAARGLQMAATGMQLRKSQAELAADEAMSAILARGGELNSTTLASLQKQTGASMQYLTGAATTLMNYDEKELLNNLQRNSRTPEALNKFLGQFVDPDATDNISPTVVKQPDGKFVVMYGKKPLDQFGVYDNFNELVVDVQGYVTGNRLEMAGIMSRLRLQRAQAEQAEAQAGALRGKRPPLSKEQEIALKAMYESDAWKRTLTMTDEAAKRGAQDRLLKDYNLTPADAGIPEDAWKRRPPSTAAPDKKDTGIVVSKPKTSAELREELAKAVEARTAATARKTEQSEEAAAAAALREQDAQELRQLSGTEARRMRNLLPRSSFTDEQWRALTEAASKK